MTRIPVGVLLLLSSFLSYAKNYTGNPSNINRDTIYFLSEPIDIGESLKKDQQIFIQGMIVGSDRFLVINVKNAAIRSPRRLILKNKERILSVNASSTAVTTNFISCLDAEVGDVIFFKVSRVDIEPFRAINVLSLHADDLSIALTRSASRKLRRMISRIR